MIYKLFLGLYILIYTKSAIVNTKPVKWSKFLSDSDVSSM